jgi:hypothetical protein
VLPKDRIDGHLRLRKDLPQLILPAKALGVDLVDALRAGRARRKPVALRADLDTANGRVVPGSENDDAVDFFPR